MRRCVLGERVVAAANVTTCRAPAQVHPPPAGGVALGTTRAARQRRGIDCHGLILPAHPVVWGRYRNTAMGLSGQAQGYEVLHRWGAFDGVAYGRRESIVVDVHPALGVLSLKLGPGQHGEPFED